VITLEPYQERAVDFLACRTKALVHSPAGSGKTIIAAAALDRVIRARPRTRKVCVVWIANTNEQCDQGRAALASFPAIQEWCECFVGCPAGFTKDFECDVMIVDECHHAPAPTWSAIIDQHKGALWMFSATPFDTNEDRNKRLREMCDNQIVKIERAEVKNRVVHGIVRMVDASDTILEGTDSNMQAGIDDVIESELKRLIPRVLFMQRWDYWGKIEQSFCAEHGLKRGENIDLTWQIVDKANLTKEANLAIHSACKKDMWPRVAFKVCLSLGIAKNRERNHTVVDIAKAHAKDSTLILIHSVAHGEGLSDHLPGSIVCHSKMGAKKRRAAIEGFRAGSVRCLIATSLADEGLDVPRANVLVMACGGKSAGRTEQRAGRATRAFGEFKTHGTIYDFHDYQHPLLASQSRKRQAVYRELGYTIEEYNPDQLNLFNK